MLKVYCAGRYSAPTDSGICANVAAALEAAIPVARLGCSPILPHTSHVVILGNDDYQTAMDYCEALLARCDAVYLQPGWALSPGAVHEKQFAEDLGIPVFSSLDALAEWLQRAA